MQYVRRSPVFDLFVPAVLPIAGRPVFLCDLVEQNLRLLLSVFAHELARGEGLGQRLEMPLDVRLELREDNGSYQIQLTLLR